MLTTASVENSLTARQATQQLKQRIHQRLVESLDLVATTHVGDERVREEVSRLTWEFVDAEVASFDGECPVSREELHAGVQSELYGLGPLEELLTDPQVSDILVNGHDEVFVERRGELDKTDVVFADNQHLMRIIQRVVARVGRRIDEVSPVVDARLPDGSRVNAIIPPLALGGPKLSIRRFMTGLLQLESLVENGSLTNTIADFLAAAVEARMNILISGGAGAGKTTLLDALSESIPRSERIITVEDSAELILNHPHVVRLETRPGNAEGLGEFSQRELVRNSLRMRPDRIILGEVRGPEALDMLQAMNTGHEGSLSTIHANDTRDALGRMEMMVSMAGFDLPIPVVRDYMSRGIDLIVHVARLKGGIRRVLRVSELLETVDGDYQLKDVFECRQCGIDEDGRARTFMETPTYQPRCLQRFLERGVNYDGSCFD